MFLWLFPQHLLCVGKQNNRTLLNLCGTGQNNCRNSLGPSHLEQPPSLMLTFQQKDRYLSFYLNLNPTKFSISMIGGKNWVYGPSNGTSPSRVYKIRWTYSTLFEAKFDKDFLPHCWRHKKDPLPLQHRPYRKNSSREMSRF